MKEARRNALSTLLIDGTQLYCLKGTGSRTNVWSPSLNSFS